MAGGSVTIKSRLHPTGQVYAFTPPCELAERDLRELVRLRWKIAALRTRQRKPRLLASRIASRLQDRVIQIVLPDLEAAVLRELPNGERASIVSLFVSESVGAMA